MLRREIIRITALALAGLFLALYLYAGSHDWRAFFLVAYLPCLAYGGLAIFRWLWGLFRWFMQMQFMSIAHRSVLGVVLALVALGIGGMAVLSGGALFGLYRIIRNMIEDVEMDRVLMVDGQE